MSEWPETPAIRACVAWNEEERRRALREAKSDDVPKGMVKIVDNKKVPLTLDEYRAQRTGDATRFARNIKALKERL